MSNLKAVQEIEARISAPGIMIYWKFTAPQGVTLYALKALPLSVQAEWIAYFKDNTDAELITVFDEMSYADAITVSEGVHHSATVMGLRADYPGMGLAEGFLRDVNDLIGMSLNINGL